MLPSYEILLYFRAFQPLLFLLYPDYTTIKPAGFQHFNNYISTESVFIRKAHASYRYTGLIFHKTIYLLYYFLPHLSYSSGSNLQAKMASTQKMITIYVIACVPNKSFPFNETFLKLTQINPGPTAPTIEFTIP